MKHGKKYSDAAKAFDRATQFEPAEAIALAKKSAVAKFDETIEVHIRTGCDGRHADQQIRGKKHTGSRNKYLKSGISGDRYQVFFQENGAQDDQEITA